MKLQPIDYWKFREFGLIEFDGETLDDAEITDLLANDITLEIRVLTSRLKGWGEFTSIVRLTEFLTDGTIWEQSYYLATPDVARRAA